jgi:hypothetical protein
MMPTLDLRASTQPLNPESNNHTPAGNGTAFTDKRNSLPIFVNNQWSPAKLGKLIARNPTRLIAHAYVNATAWKKHRRMMQLSG